MISKNFMDPPTSPRPYVSNRNDNPLLDDEKIKPMILGFNEKIKLNPLVINKPADDHSLQLGAIVSNVNDTMIAPDTEDYKEMDQKGAGVRPSGACSPAEMEEELWPKITELDDRPPSPSSQSIAIKQVISESTYVSSKQADLLDNHSVDDERKPSTTAQLTSKRAFQSSKQSSKQAQIEPDSWPSSPDLHKTGRKPPKGLQGLREGNHQQGANEAMLDEFSLNPLSSPTHQDIVKPRVQSALRDPTSHDPNPTVLETYRISAQPRLSSVVEESESFSRREFGDNALNYMSTFSSANHATLVSQQHADDSGVFDYKRVSYRHNNYHHFTYNLSASHEPATGNFKNSKSAPAGTATRSGSAFGLFRRGTSERSGLRLGRRPIYRPNKPRKPRTLASTLLWPLLKIRNGYVGCMMGLEGTGDLTGMMQGGTYATTTRYFADVPLSKSDSRNFG